MLSGVNITQLSFSLYFSTSHLYWGERLLYLSWSWLVPERTALIKHKARPCQGIHCVIFKVLPDPCAPRWWWYEQRSPCSWQVANKFSCNLPSYLNKERNWQQIWSVLILQVPCKTHVFFLSTHRLCVITQGQLEYNRIHQEHGCREHACNGRD